MTTLERKYALTKIAPGDYLLPSNDAQIIWRIARYEDGPSHGVDEMPRDRGFWGLWRWHGESLYSDELGAAPVDPDDWERWSMEGSGFDTRAEAIVEAMQVTAASKAVQS